MTTSHQNIIVRVASDLRVRPLPGQPGIEPGKNVQFPKHLRVPGCRFSCTLTLSAGGSFYRAATSSIVSVSSTQGPSAAGALAQANVAPAAPKPARVPVPAPRVLEPDEVIDGGRDAAFNPCASARYAYGVTGSTNTAHGAALRSTAESRRTQWAEWPAFVREVFCVLYDEEGTPALPEDERSQWAAGAVAGLVAQPEWEALRAAAQVSRVIAAETTTALAETIGAALGRRNSAPHDPRDLTDTAETWAVMLNDAGGTEAQIEEAMQDLDAALVAAGKARGDASACIAMNAGGIRRAVVAALEKAEATADVIRQSVGLGFSLEGPASLAEVCPELLRELREDARVSRILAWVGRFKDSADGALARTVGMTSIVDLSLTGDLGRIVPDARVRLASPGVLGTLALTDVLEEQAVGFEGEAHEPRADGDLVVLYDRSGSMAGGADEQARALSIAALLACYRQQRRCTLVTFAATHDNDAVALVPGDHAALAACVRALCRPSDGCGTDVESALSRAMLEAPKRPDVLVVTDGAFPVLTKQTLDALGDARIFGVFVDASGADAHPEFAAGWDVTGEITDALAAEVINALRKPRAQKRKRAA